MYVKQWTVREVRSKPETRYNHTNTHTPRAVWHPRSLTFAFEMLARQGHCTVPARRAGAGAALSAPATGIASFSSPLHPTGQLQLAVMTFIDECNSYCTQLCQMVVSCDDRSNRRGDHRGVYRVHRVADQQRTLPSYVTHVPWQITHRLQHISCSHNEAYRISITATQSQTEIGLGLVRFNVPLDT